MYRNQHWLKSVWIALLTVLAAVMTRGIVLADFRNPMVNADTDRVTISDQDFGTPYRMEWERNWTLQNAPISSETKNEMCFEQELWVSKQIYKIHIELSGFTPLKTKQCYKVALRAVAHICEVTE